MIRVRTLLTGVPGSPFYSNLFFGGGDSTVATEAVQNVKAFWTSVAVLMTPGVVIGIEPFVASINPATGDVVGGFTVDPGVPLGSSGAGGPIPPASQLLASLLTGSYVAGRQIRGKFNLPMVTEEHNVGLGVPDQGSRDLLRQAFTALVDGGPELQVWSRKNGVAVGVSSVSVSTKWAVLRSRRD